MRLAVTIAALVALASAGNAQPLRIGVAAPLSGPTALLGQQVKAGAEAAATARGMEAVTVDDGCSAEGGAEAARRFVAAGVAMVTGFLCTEAIEAALPILKQAGIATIATGIRSGGLTCRRDKTGWLVVRYAPRADSEVEAAAELLGRRWRDRLFAIVDDGTIYSRDLAEGFRLAVEAGGLRPVLTDSLRPQLENQIGLAGRLRRSGATHVFVAADRADVAILARDAAQLDYPLTIAGGEVLRASPDAVDLADGALMVGLPEWSAVADAAVVQALRDAGTEPDGYVLPAYASVEIAAQALQFAAQTGSGTMQVLGSEQFQTVLGPVEFDDKGDRTDNPYRLFRYEAGRFIETE